MKKIKWMIGVLILIIASSLISSNISKKDVEYKSDLEIVKRIYVDADISNIVIVTGGPMMNVRYKGQKSFVGSPSMDIVYEKDQAIIKLKAIQKKWMTIVPGLTKRGELILNIPTGLLEHVQINTRNGNITAKNVSEINQLSFSSSVGNINVDSFKGEVLNIEAKNGSIKIGSVDGAVNIKNQTGSLKSLVFTHIKGKSKIKLSNGNVHITLPKELEKNKISFNIATKNGKITSENDKLLIENIIKQGAGNRIVNYIKSDNELDISVSVGHIKIK
ncbi:DUF4097 family beta strand repeat-containing protein [Viridibacillus sp. NPDC093762]|uniref:DUF4097 family beta strand repeat-containing protein n=1 Tax=Viridibacillus sp. NPDC093762 TaxID=3390720 RepID=UPI003D00D62A